MKIYMGAYAIKNQKMPGRYLIGVKVASLVFSFLGNSRFVFTRKLCISPVLNPWGYKGETPEAILQYLRESHDRKMIPYPARYNVSPIVKSLEPVPIIGHDEPVDTDYLYIWDIADDFEESLKNPISVNDSTWCFDVNGRYSWGQLIGDDSNSIEYNGLILDGLVLTAEEHDILTKPYYVIKTEDGNYYKNDEVTSYLLTTAKQFSVELDALKTIMENDEILDNGFEVEEIAPPHKIDLLNTTPPLL